MDTQNPADVFAQLSAPMPFKWRLKQVANKAKKPYPEGSRGQFLAYIDARDVFNRLDAVLGSWSWQDSVKRINEDGSVIVSLALCVNGEWLTKEDVGYPNNPGAGVEEEPLKAAVSDGIKRAAIHFGVGRFLYDMAPVWTEIDQYGNPKRPLGEGPVSRARHIEAEARQRFEDADDLDEKIAAGAVAMVAGNVADVVARRPNQAPPGPAADGENRPCSIEGCAGVCLGSWVGFSVRKYGVVLCSKHSAMAKRGELDDQLAVLNATQQAGA